MCIRDSPDTDDGREERLSSSRGGSGRGREFRVCSGELPVHRSAVAVWVERGPRVVGSGSQCYPTGAATDDTGIGNDSGRRSGGYSACSDRRGQTGVEAEPLPEGCTVKAVEGG